jgi:hypothetical protein
MTTLWDVASCSLVEVDRHFKGAYDLHHQGDETTIYLNETIRRCIPEGCHLRTRRRENLKSRDDEIVEGGGGGEE